MSRPGTGALGIGALGAGAGAGLGAEEGFGGEGGKIPMHPVSL